MDIRDIINELEDMGNLNFNIIGIAVNELAENHVLQHEVDGNIHLRNENYYEETILNYSPDDFYDHFRMSRGTFQLLLEKLGRNIQTQHTIPLEKKLLFSIWVLSKQESFLATGDRFNLAKSSAHFVFYEIMEYVSNFRNEYIQWPSDTKREIISHEFELKCGIAGIVGAIDGCHVEIKAPVNNPVDFYNRNNYHSVILQGTCDNNMLFTDIFVGCPGRMHDARVYQLSPLYERLANNLNPLLPVTQHLLGDAAYPLSMFLMKPYRDNGHLNDIQILFNTRLSRARSTIERAFGQLKGKFRKLKYLDMARDDKIPVVVTAACVIHNFILLHEKGVVINVEEDFEHDDDVQNNDDDNRGGNAAEEKRNNIARHLQ